MFTFALTHAYLIPLFPALAFLIIGPFTRQEKNLSAAIAITMMSLAFAFSVFVALATVNYQITMNDPYVMKALWAQIRDVKKFHPTLSIRGILVNQYISYPGFSHMREDVSDVGIPLFQTKISYATRNAKHGLMTASRDGKSIFEVCPNCRVARDIMRFAEELLG